MTNLYHYNGRDNNGNYINQEIEANDVEEVVAHLKKYNITPINITPVQSSSFNLKKILTENNLFNKVEQYHLMNFCRQLGVLTDAGLSLIKAINKLSESASSKSLSRVLAQVAIDIAAGLSLSDALKKHPKIFTPLMTSIIDIGENTGHLSESLKYLSTYIESTIANRRRLLSAIRYPIFVIITITAAFLVMNYMVIPKFMVMFSRFNLELPLATWIIMTTSNFLVNNSKALLIAAIITAVGINRVMKIPAISLLWDKYKLYFPIFGELQRRIIISQFTWTFSLISRSGVPIIKGITLASSATDNAYFSVQLAKMSQAIEHGENLSRAAITSGLFTPITIQMIEVGEESEKLDEALAEVARYYDAEIDYDLKRLNELLEPILLVMIGGIVLVLAIGIYFPMWDLIKIAKI